MLFGESLKAGGHIEEISITISRNKYGRYFLFEIVLNQLNDNFHDYSFTITNTFIKSH